VLISLWAHLHKLGHTEEQERRLCGYDKEDSVHIVCDCPVLACGLTCTNLDTQKNKNADCVDMIKRTVYTLCVTVLSWLVKDTGSGAVGS
jgi:hypothetical protein